MGKVYRVSKYNKVNDFGEEDNLADIVRSERSLRKYREIRELKGSGREGRNRLGMRWRGGESDEFFGSEEDIMSGYKELASKE
jgi:hypothetical protein